MARIESVVEPSRSTDLGSTVGPRRFASGGPPILWGVFREHFEEAQFLLSRWDLAHDRPDGSLERIADGPELRLARHVEALVAGGPSVLERVLWPWLLPEAEEGAFEPQGPRTIAALVAVTLRGPEGADRVVEMMRGLSPEQRAGTRRAFVLWDDERAESWIAQILAKVEVDELAGWLEVAARRQMAVTRESLDRALREGPPATVAAALDAIAVSRQPGYAVVAEYRLDDPDERVRAAALRAAAILGSSMVCPRLAELVRDESSPFAGELMALLGSAAEHEDTIAWAGEADASEHALWCLGLTGRAAAAEAAARRLDDEAPRIAKLAFEAFRAITGLPPDDAFVDREPAQEGVVQPEELSSDPVDALPLPRVDEVRAWWERHRDELEPEPRYLHGVRSSPAGVRNALLHGSARRRHVLALETAARSRGACLIPTRAWSWRQRGPIRSVGGSAIDFQASWSSIRRRVS